ncbi:MAG: hypothetical protein RSB70_06395 [Clostridium sp.]
MNEDDIQCIDRVGKLIKGEKIDRVPLIPYIDSNRISHKQGKGIFITAGSPMNIAQ